MKEELTKELARVLMRKNPGLLDDEAQRQAEAVMMYYEDIKTAELNLTMD